MRLKICSGHELIYISALQSFKKGCLYFYFYFYFCFEEPSSVSSPQTIELYSSNFCVLGILLCTDDMGFALHHHLSHFHCVWDSLFTNMSCPIQWRRVEKNNTNPSIHFGAVLLIISSPWSPALVPAASGRNDEHRVEPQPGESWWMTHVCWGAVQKIQELFWVWPWLKPNKKKLFGLYCRRKSLLTSSSSMDYNRVADVRFRARGRSLEHPIACGQG